MDPYARLSAACLVLLSSATTAASTAPPRPVAVPSGPVGPLELEIAVAGTPDTVGRIPHATSGQVSATLRAGTLQARLGPQKLAWDSLIHRDLKRRGAVAAWDLGGGGRFRGFGLEGRAAPGFQRLVGADRVDCDLNGLLIEQPVLTTPHGGVDLAFGWISGVARADRAGVRDGDAWSVAADADLLARSLRVQAEYAVSNFDWATASDGQPPPPGGAEAYRLELEWRAADAATVDWRLGTELSEVGHRFGSLGNPALGADSRQWRTHGGLGVGAWQVDLDLRRRHDNPAREPLRPAVVRDKLQLATAWSPGEAGALDAIGIPSYKLTATIGRKRTFASGAVPGGGAPAQASYAVALQGEFAQSHGLWGLRAKSGLAPGAIDAGAGAGVRSVGFDLYGDVALGAAVPLKPALTWKRRRDAVTGTRMDTWRARVGSSPVDLQADLRAAFDVAVEHRDRPGASAPALGADFGTDVVYTLQRPSSQRRGWALVLKGSLVTGSSPGSADRAPGLGLMVSLTTDHPLGGW